MLTPAFHFRILEDFIPVFNEQAVIFVKNLKEQQNKKYIDIVPLVTLCTLDIICGELAPDTQPAVAARVSFLVSWQRKGKRERVPLLLFLS